MAKGTLSVTTIARVAWILVSVECSHFRGGVITWRALDTSPLLGTFPTVRFTYRLAYRSTFGSNHFCDQNTIIEGNINSGEGILECDNGCSTINSGILDYICTDFSASGGWTQGEGAVDFTPNTKNFDVFYRGNNWIPLMNGGNGDWIIRSRINLTARADNGLINSSPTTAVMPVVTVMVNCRTRFQIPVADPDQDTIRCRFATSERDECGTICESVGSIDEANCTLEWIPTQVGLYGVAIQVEDFITPSSETPLSSVPLQFLFEVIEGDGPCDQSPFFGPGVLPADSCIGVPFGDSFITRITANVLFPNRRIVSIDTVSPMGLVTTSVQRVPVSDVAYFIDVTYRVNNPEQVEEIFCFLAEDSEEMTTEQRCIFFVTATSPPIATSATIDANGLVTITFDQTIRIPTTPRTISISSAQTGEQIVSLTTSSDAILSFDQTAILLRVPTPLPFNDSLMANLERGAVESTTFCGIGNDPTVFTLDNNTPVTSCPVDMIMMTANGELFYMVGWAFPNPGPNFRRIVGPPISQHKFPVGTDTTIRYIFRSPTETYICAFRIVIGPEPDPCQEDLTAYMLRGTGGSVVTWEEPVPRDRIITSPIPSGAFLPPGITTISYTFRNVFEQSQSCAFNVEVIEISPCDNMPCGQNGRCVAFSLGSFQCICNDGCYYGEFCEISSNSCGNDPCVNGGTCKLFDGSCSLYSCVCPPCFRGPRCESPIDPCVSNQCRGGSTCRAVPGSCERYVCECQNCSFGTFCESEVNPCEFNPCGADDRCIRNTDNCFSYTCESTRGNPSSELDGREIIMRDRCLSSPCLNLGVCVNVELMDGTASFICLCLPGYGGNTCGGRLVNEVVRNCLSSPCLFAGECYERYIDETTVSIGYMCVCAPGWARQDCASQQVQSDPCFTGNNEPCLNGGICRNIYVSPDNEDNFLCDCPVGYSGSRCETQVENPCSSSPCRNDGTCTPRGGSYQCACPIETFGPTCEMTPVEQNPPMVLRCPDDIIARSDFPIRLTWQMPLVLDFDSIIPVRMVYANASPNAVYNPGHFQSVELVFEDVSGNQARCEFIIYIEPVTL